MPSVGESFNHAVSPAFVCQFKGLPPLLLTASDSTVFEPTDNVPKSRVVGETTNFAAGSATVKLKDALRELIPSVARRVCGPGFQVVLTGIVIAKEPVALPLSDVVTELRSPAAFTHNGLVPWANPETLVEAKSRRLLSKVSVMLLPGTK